MTTTEADGTGGTDGDGDRRRAEAARTIAHDAEPTEVDLVVIGGGSGNTIADERFADRSVVIVDDGRWFGGTCLNAGCIPTKMLVRVADDQVDAQDAARLGLADGGGVVDWDAVRDRVFGRIDAISAGGEEYRAHGSDTVELVRESVELVDPRTIRTASGRLIRGRDLVIAAGSRPRVLPAIDMSDPDVHDSDTIMRVATRPDRLLIVGGGSVAVEFAHVFSAFGSHVTLVVRGERLVADLDADVSRRFTQEAASRADVRLGTEVRGVRRRSGGDLVVELDDGSVVAVDAVLVAAGRVSNADTLKASEAGLDVTEDGRIAVDDEQRVLAHGAPLSGTWALGDVSDPWQLKHVANHQARLVAHNILHPDSLRGGHPGPVAAAVFAHPQLAHVGMTEEEARRSGRDVVAVTHELGSTAYGWALEDTTSFVKLVVERGTGRLLGAHVIGPEASILIQPLIALAAEGRSVVGVARGQYWPHPAETEVVENALLDAEDALADGSDADRDDGSGAGSDADASEEAEDAEDAA